MVKIKKKKKMLHPTYLLTDQIKLEYIQILAQYTKSIFLTSLSWKGH